MNRSIGGALASRGCVLQPTSARDGRHDARRRRRAVAVWRRQRSGRLNATQQKSSIFRAANTRQIGLFSFPSLPRLARVRARSIDYGLRSRNIDRSRSNETQRHCAKRDGTAYGPLRSSSLVVGAAARLHIESRPHSSASRCRRRHHRRRRNARKHSLCPLHVLLVIVDRVDRPSGGVAHRSFGVVVPRPTRFLGRGEDEGHHHTQPFGRSHG